MDKIVCPHCKREFELNQALMHKIEEDILTEERAKQKEQIEVIKAEIQKDTEKRVRSQLELNLKDSKSENEEAKKTIRELQNQLLDTTKILRELKDKDQQRDLDMQKKLLVERDKMQEEIGKTVKEKSDIEIGEIKKQLDDTKKALEEAQRKAAQKSGQLHGEVLELELEALLRTTFPMDEIDPVGKGVTGADIRHLVKSPKGFSCGVILWESKRTKGWQDRWIPKLKEDVLNEKAMCSVIVSAELPAEAKNGFGIKEGVWICNQSLVLPLATILRKNMLDIAYQKAIAANRGEKSDLLYSYVTSHEFAQQVENLVEAYQEMHIQITKERASFERSLKQREMQIQRVLMSTASIIGSMQGVVGPSMPIIKGLELTDASEEPDSRNILD